MRFANLWFHQPTFRFGKRDPRIRGMLPLNLLIPPLPLAQRYSLYLVAWELGLIFFSFDCSPLFETAVVLAPRRILYIPPLRFRSIFFLSNFFPHLPSIFQSVEAVHKSPSNLPPQGGGPGHPPNTGVPGGGVLHGG